MWHKGRNEPSHLVSLTEEFPCIKTLHHFLVMYWKAHFLGVVDESICRMHNVFLSFFHGSPHVPSTRRTSERRRECVTTWSGQPSTATMWRPCSSSRRSSTSWRTNMAPGEAFPQGKREPTPCIWKTAPCIISLLFLCTYCYLTHI